MSLHGHNLANDTPHIVGILPSRGIIPIDGWIYFYALVDPKKRKEKKRINNENNKILSLNDMSVKGNGT
jgi:hypothetical protein